MVTRTATDVHLTDAPARTIVRRLASTSQAGLRDVIGPSLADLYAAAGQGGAQPAGPPMVIYHAYTEDHAWSIEVCLPIAHQIDAPPGFSCRQLPREPVVSAVHVGPYETIGDTYGEIEHFAATHAVRFSGAPREIYLSMPGTPPDQIRTIIERPIIPLAQPLR